MAGITVPRARVSVMRTSAWADRNTRARMGAGGQNPARRLTTQMASVPDATV